MPIAEAKKPGKSDPRNETMLKIFGFVNVGERAGSGLTTIFDGWREAGYAEPYYEVEYGPDRTILTLPLTPAKVKICQQNPESASKSENLPAKLLLEGLAKNDYVVYEYLQSAGESKSNDIAATLKIPPRTVRAIISRLKDAGLIEAIGTNRSTRYRAKS